MSQPLYSPAGAVAPRPAAAVDAAVAWLVGAPVPHENTHTHTHNKSLMSDGITTEAVSPDPAHTTNIQHGTGSVTDMDTETETDSHLLRLDEPAAALPAHAERRALPPQAARALHEATAPGIIQCVQLVSTIIASMHGISVAAPHHQQTLAAQSLNDTLHIPQTHPYFCANQRPFNLLHHLNATPSPPAIP